MAEEDKQRKAECSNCGGLRNCNIHGSKNVTIGDHDYSSSTNWYLLECRGCNAIFVQTVSTNSEDYFQQYVSGGSGETEYVHDETISYWPALSKRPKPEWMEKLEITEDDEDELKAAMTEVYGALNADLRMLAGIGIRTCFDVASELLEIDTTLPFARKLEVLVSSGRIGVVDKDRIGALVDAGSASAHRGWRPSHDDLKIMMDVLENFILETFVAPARRAKLNEDAAAMKTKVPARKPRAKKAPQKS